MLGVQLLVAAGPGVSSAAALPPPGPGVPVWAADWMADGSSSPTYDPGSKVALRQARKFDIIIAHTYTYAKYVADMKVANPNVRLLVYMNGVFTPKTDYPSRWYAVDALGRRIKSQWFGTWLMNPRSVGWIGEVTNQCTLRLTQSHYDGCFLDELGTGAVNPLYVSSLPINPATGKEYTKKEWLDATEALAAAVRSSLSGPVAGNGLGDGTRYFDTAAPTERILDGLVGGMSEGFIRAAKSAVDEYESETRWKQDVDMLADAGARSSGGIVFAITKLWVKATSAQVDAWHLYALGSFLLGYRPGHAYFSFRSDKALTSPHPWWDVDLGDPLDAYGKVSGVYQRTFSAGKVLVNPTTSTFTVSLGGTYKDLSGVTRSSVTLGPHSATILRSV
jgi:hypothetical protein